MTDVCALATSYAHTLLSFLVNSSPECPCFSWSEVNSYTKHKLLLSLCLRDELASTTTDSRYPFSPAPIPLHTKKKLPSHFISYLAVWLQISLFPGEERPPAGHMVPLLSFLFLFGLHEKGDHLSLECLLSFLEMSSSLGQGEDDHRLKGNRERRLQTNPW